MYKVPFCHPQYNKKAVFLEFYCLLSIYFWGRVFDNLGGAGEQIKILVHLFTPERIGHFTFGSFRLAFESLKARLGSARLAGQKARLGSPKSRLGSITTGYPP